jgi:uncharacterized membrane protein YbaN (DUF454 family)
MGVRAIDKVAFTRGLKRVFFLISGLFFFALGIIGFIVPGLPGTIWLIIAAACFVRSSEKLYKVVVNNRFFGKLIRDYRENGLMPKRAKIISLMFIWVFSLISIFGAPYDWRFDVPVIALAIAGTVYLWRIPTR